MLQMVVTKPPFHSYRSTPDGYVHVMSEPISSPSSPDPLVPDPDPTHTPVIPDPDPTHTPVVPEPDPTHTPVIPDPDPTAPDSPPLIPEI